MKRYALVLAAAALAAFSLSAPALATSSPSCHPLARLFDETTCTEELVLENGPPPESIAPDSQQAQFAAGAMERNKRQAKDLLWHKALVHKFGSAAVTASDQEIADFNKAFSRSMENSYESDKKTAAFIKDLLAKNSYSPANETKLKDILRAAETSVKFYEMRNKSTTNLTDEYRFIKDTAEKEVARALVTEWKADKALFGAYHGRLVMRGTGLEPVDAYTAFLDYIRKDGKLAILDPAYKNIFEETENPAPSATPDTPDENSLHEQYFNDPAWQFTLANNAHRFEVLKERLEAIPALPETTSK